MININEDAIIKENNLDENNDNYETIDEDDYDRVYGCEIGVSEETELAGYNPYDYQLDIQSIW